MSPIERDLLEALHRAHAALDKGHDHTAETWDDRERWKDVDPATYQGAVDRLNEWADSLERYAATHDGSPEMVRAVAVEMRHAASRSI